MYTFAPVQGTGIMSALSLAFLVLLTFYMVAGLIASVYKSEKTRGMWDGDKIRVFEKKFDSRMDKCFYAATVLALAIPFCMDYPQPANELVIGTLVQTQPGIDKETSDKRSIYVENQYVVYRVPEGVVSLKMTPGHAYPDRVKLFKN